MNQYSFEQVYELYPVAQKSSEGIKNGANIGP